MTAICGGGASQLKPGAGQFIVGGGAYLEQIFAATPAFWAKAALVLVPVAVYDLLSICATDPPPMPTFTTSEQLALYGVVPGAGLFSGLAKLPDLITNVLWSTFCECAAGTATQSPIPTTTVSANVGAVTPVWKEPVSNLFGAFTTLSNSFTYGEIATVSQPFTLAQMSTWNTDNVASHQIGVWKNHVLQASVTTGHEVLNTESFYTIAPVSFVPGDIITVGILRPANVTWRQNNGATAIASTNLITGNDSGFCQSTTLCEPVSNTPKVAEWVNVQAVISGTTATTGCCPPDPAVVSLLNQILAKLASSISSYVVGGTHPGLSGTGTITLAPATIAIQVDITGTGPSQGFLSGTPQELFNVGFVTPFLGVVAYAGWRIEHGSQHFDLPALTDHLGYTLDPGVTITVTELSAG